MSDTGTSLSGNDLAVLLADAQPALEAWNKLHPSHKREYEMWLNGAVKPATRDNRVRKMIGMLTGSGTDNGES